MFTLMKYKLLNTIIPRSFLFQRINFFCNSSSNEDGLPLNYCRKASVYVHWPYCRQRCSYCNFVKYVPKSGTSWTYDNNAIEDAMEIEIRNILSNSYIEEITSVYFGGGTPSLARPNLIEKILSTLQDKCKLSANLEVTLEINPTPAETMKLSDFKIAGINRVSIGLQALDEDALRKMNRDHTLEEGLRCLERAKELYLSRVSTDLIFGREGQTLESWKKELEYLLNLSDNHISLYQLTVERGTQLHDQIRKGNIILPDEDTKAEMYVMAIEMLKLCSFNRYEISNFSRHENSESKHNKNYWQGLQYIASGPGAHSRVVPKNDDYLHVREARINVADPRNWLKEIKRKGNGVRKSVLQTSNDVLKEYVITALRTQEGITNEKWKMFSPNVTLNDMFINTLNEYFEGNYLELKKYSLNATDKGLNVIDFILPNILDVIER